jgi:hypothetical protein
VKNGENEMTFGAVDISTLGVEELRASLKAHQSKLAAAKKQRDVILIDTRKASAAADTGDQRAGATLRALAKAAAAAGRLVSSAEVQVFEAKKRLDMAENQVATAGAKKASVDGAAVQHDRLFEVATPDGRVVRHHHASAGELQKELQPGYRVTAEVFSAGNDDKGGLVEPLEKSTMKMLLAAHGDELIAFLKGIYTLDSLINTLTVPNQWHANERAGNFKGAFLDG